MASLPVNAASYGIVPKLDSTVQRLVFDIACALISSTGLLGTIFLNSTAVQSGSFSKYVALTNSVIATVTVNGSTETGVTVPAGSTFAGNITSFQLTSGTGQLYKSIAF
jgi:hypothetical protein